MISVNIFLEEVAGLYLPEARWEQVAR